MEFRLDIRKHGDAFDVHLLDGKNTPLVDARGNALVRPITPLDAESEGVFAHIVAQTPAANEMQQFGRLLFQMLIGPDWWTRILASKGAIELAVCCDQFATFNRLPWEMMSVPPDGPFLAQIPQVGIVRRISGTKAVFTAIPAPPTVLIAVGAELHHDVIRPAAECLALLNNLKDADRGIRLRTHLLLNASPDRLRTAVKHFKPHVVHLICHGEVDAEKRRGALVLAGDPGGKKTVMAHSETLLDALSRPDEQDDKTTILPSIVVLSACYTAAASMADVGQIATPLAQELAARVPLVVGMSGAITDQPCRLFARRFYESLLADGDVAQAAAHGRRAALTDAGTDPRSTVDWTMPVVCLSSAVPSTTVPIEKPSEEALEWERLANDFVTRPDIVFCDRVEVMSQYNLLMAPLEAQRAIRPEKTDLQVLAIIADEDSPDRRYGRTRLLRELAAKAALEGHVPVLVETVASQWPKTRQALLKAIMDVCTKTAFRFKVFGPVCQNLNTLLAAGGKIPDTVDPEIRSTFPSAQYDAEHPSVLAFALRLDLLALLNAIKVKRPASEREGARVLVLIDDVHKMDAAAIDLASVLLDAGGARAANPLIRVVLTYATVKGGAGPGDAPAVDALKGLNDKPWVATAALGRFRAPDEDRHAYERFLLHWSDDKHKGLALRTDSPDFASFWEVAEEFIGGVPSLLRTEGPRLVKVILKFRGVQILRPANDDDLLRQASLNTRGGN